MLCFYSIAPSTSKDDISPSALMSSLQVLGLSYRFSLVNWCIGRPIYVSSRCFGGISCNSSFYLPASWVQSVTRRYWLYARSLFAKFLWFISRGVVGLIGMQVGLHKLHLAISVAFSIALISIRCIIFTVNDSEVVDCGHEFTLLFSSFSFRSTWMFL